VAERFVVPLKPGNAGGGKPTFDRARLDLVFEMLNQQASPSAISKATGLSRQTVYRIKDNPAKAEGLLVQWSR
jgi:putative DNA-invertase from lambdoid prophage Rac